MSSDDPPWTPNQLRNTLDGPKSALREFLMELYHRVGRQVAELMGRCRCLRLQTSVGREDLVQEILKRLTVGDYAKLRDWRGDPAYIWAYVRGFSWRVASEACRTCQRRPAPNDRDSPDPESALGTVQSGLDDQIDHRDRLQRTLDALEDSISARKFKAFTLSLEGVSRAAIATQLGVRLLIVDQDLHVARKKFKEIWERDNGKPGRTS
jgi:DNA-directed RNA polymerase specialized sigma24 family protein